MSTIVNFRSRREEAASSRPSPAAGNSEPARPDARGTAASAEIILFPRKHRGRPKRKPLKRRFAKQQAAAASAGHETKVVFLVSIRNSPAKEADAAALTTSTPGWRQDSMAVGFGIP